MNRTTLALLFTFTFGVIVGHLIFPSTGAVMAQSPRPVLVTRLFTGPDNQTHTEEIAVDFTAANAGLMAKLLPITAGELHVGLPGSVNDWHRAPRRQYVITLSGRGEIEIAGGKKISDGPGHIALVEDRTGKGHITRVVGGEDRVTLQLPLADQSGH